MLVTEVQEFLIDFSKMTYSKKQYQYKMVRTGYLITETSLRNVLHSICK